MHDDLSTSAAIKRTSPVRVLLAAPPMGGRGGVSQYWRVLRPHWREEVQYFTIGSRAAENPMSTPFRMARDSWRFARTLRRGNFDVVHLNPSMLSKALVRDGILLLLAKALRKRVLVFAHGWNPVWDPELPRCLRYVFRLVYGRADAFIVLGSRFERRLRVWGYEKRVFVERAPVADELLDDSGEERKESCTLSGHRFWILFLARVEREKGIYETLDTYRVLKQKHRFVSLTVAGEGSELSAARRYASARELEDVSFVGHVDGANKRHLFRTANAYLLPSYHEGLPLSVLEAMAFGLPIVAADVGALRDFFEDGKMGFISNSRDPEVLASLLSRLISDPDLCSNIGQFNRDYVRSNFTAHQLAIRLEGIYRLLAEQEIALIKTRELSGLASNS